MSKPLPKFHIEPVIPVQEGAFSRALANSAGMSAGVKARVGNVLRGAKAAGSAVAGAVTGNADKVTTAAKDVANNRKDPQQEAVNAKAKKYLQVVGDDLTKLFPGVDVNAFVMDMYDKITKEAISSKTKYDADKKAEGPLATDGILGKIASMISDPGGKKKAAAAQTAAGTADVVDDGPTSVDEIGAVKSERERLSKFLNDKTLGQHHVDMVKDYLSKLEDDPAAYFRTVRDMKTPEGEYKYPEDSREEFDDIIHQIKTVNNKKKKVA
jgi:hypothetical protein